LKRPWTCLSSYIHDERQEGISPEELKGPKEVKESRNVEEDNEAEQEHDADMVAFAASTGMGFGMGYGMSPIEPMKQNGLDKDDDDSNTPTQTAYEGRTQFLKSKRMSIEKQGLQGSFAPTPLEAPV
jgi:hypothetical protein